MAKTTQKPQQRKVAANTSFSDSGYFLKLVLYIMISSQWLRLTHGSQWEIPLPYGAAIALVFAAHEHFRIDRKIEYAIILVAMLVGFWVPAGLQILL